MQNLQKILLRYSNFLVFIALEVAAFLLIVYNSAYPRSSVLSTANSVIAWQYEVLSEIGGYFHLRSVNRDLAAENAELRNMLAMRDSNMQEMRYAQAKVVHMTTDRQDNFLTINRGARDGIVRGMGVRNGEGVVGIIKTVGRKYSVVIPTINTASNLSCRFKKNDYIATLQWVGTDYRYAQLVDVATHMVVNAGDTIVTSGLSPVFPENIPVGIVESCTLEQGASYYSIRLRLNTNFRRLHYVEVIENSDRQEMEELNNELD